MRGIFGKETFYEPVKGQATKLKATQSYVYRKYKVTSPRCPICDELIQRGKLKEDDNCSRLRVMSLKTGCYLRHCGGHLRGQDLVQYYMNTDMPSFHLLEERPVTMEECVKMFEQGELDYCACWDLIEIFETRSGRNL